MNRSWRIIGVGTPHGDDALGLEVINRMSHETDDRDGWEFHAVDSAQRILDLLDADSSVILIDAIALETQVGTIHRFTWPNSQMEFLRPGSTHALGVVQTLELAAVLGHLPKEFVVFGVESGSFQENEELSQELKAAIPELLRQIRLEMRTMRRNARELDKLNVQPIVPSARP